MPFSKLPNEILLRIVHLLNDPFDENAFLQITPRNYALLSFRFSRKYSEVARVSLKLDAKKDLQYRFLAIRATKQRWTTVSRAMAKRLPVLEYPYPQDPYIRLRVRYFNPGNLPEHPIVIESQSHSCPDYLQFLIDHGADPNTYRVGYGNPLYYSIRNTFIRNVEVLLRAGANPNGLIHFVGAEQTTPLEMITGSVSTTYGTVWWKPQYEMLCLLIKYGADPNFASYPKSWPEPPLHQMARYSFDGTVLLLNSGADINNVDSNGETALHVWARPWDFVRHQQQSSFNHVLDPGIGNLLLDRGAQIDRRNTLGQTVLMMAAFERRSETVRMLLQRGADIDVVDNTGKRARDYWINGKAMGHFGTAWVSDRTVLDRL